MKLSTWLKRRLSYLALAMGGVEKSILSQNVTETGSPLNQERRHTQGTLADSLKQGEITQEVMNLRWRLYKVLKASENLESEILEYKDGLPVTKTIKVDRKRGLSRVKTDTVDKYTLEMVVDNSPIVTNTNDSIDNDNINLFDEVKINYTDNGDIDSVTHGEISGEEYFATNKQQLPINIIRDITPKFDIETYTKKLNIRTISKTERLLEFYVSMYPDEYDRRSRLFISDIKKAIENPRVSTILDIKGVGFITYKTIGVEDFLEYQYKVLSFDKIIEFNGYYVIKFKCEVVIDGVNITDKYRVEDLDIKYENKERKKQ